MSDEPPDVFDSYDICALCNKPIEMRNGDLLHVNSKDFAACSGFATRIEVTCVCHDMGPPCSYCRHQAAHRMNPSQFDSLAGVAQSGERLPRKQEAAGSTPVTSSRAQFSNDQRKMVSNIVASRLYLEDIRKQLQAAIETEKKLQSDLKLCTHNKVSLELKSIQAETNHILAERQLREAILEDALVFGVPARIDTPKEVESQPSPENIGREA